MDCFSKPKRAVFRIAVSLSLFHFELILESSLKVCRLFFLLTANITFHSVATALSQLYAKRRIFAFVLNGRFFIFYLILFCWIFCWIYLRIRVNKYREVEFVVFRLTSFLNIYYLCQFLTSLIVCLLTTKTKHDSLTPNFSNSI